MALADIKEAIRRMRFEYKLEGAEEILAGQAAIRVETEKSERAALSLEKSFGNLERRYVSTVRAQQNYERVQQQVNDAIKQNPALQERGNVILQNAEAQYKQAAAGVQTYGKALQQGTGEARLARHELINLSRQIQDVGVSLASGQAPLTVLVQQGSQIADVFATSTGTIRGFFTQAAAGAGRFLLSATGIATSAAAIGVGMLAAGSSAASAQRDIEKGLSGMGRASGVTRDQINAIGEASAASFGLSRSEALTTATAFASIGKNAANIAQATKLVDDFARAGGDAAEMTKTLGAALQDPAKGALELNKAYGFLNVATLENIRLLQAQGKEQEAQKALMDALTPTMEKQAELVGTWTKMWNRTANALSNIWSGLGKDLLRLGEQFSGASLGGFTTEEQLGRARERQTALRSSPFQGALAQPGIKAADLEVARLEAKKLAEELDRAAAAFNKLSTEALAAADGFMPLQAQIRDTQQALAKLREYEAAGGYVNRDAIAAGEIRLQQLLDQSGALARQNEYTQAIAAQYPGMSIEVAKQLNAMQGQLTVAQARTGAEKIVAQEYVTQNNLLAQGKTLEEAVAIAATERAIAEANVSRAINDQIHNLEQQIELSKARMNGTEATVKAEQAYVNAIRQGASEIDAAALKAATLANEQQQAAEAATRGAQATRLAADAMVDYVYQCGAARIQWDRMVAATVDARLNMLDTQFEGETYTFSWDPMGFEHQKNVMEATYGKENVVTDIGSAGQYLHTTAKPEYFENMFKQQNEDFRKQIIEGLDVSSPASIQQSFNKLLVGDLDLETINRLTALAQPEQQASLIQQTISAIQAREAPGLAREEMINTLNDKLEQLTKSTDSLNATMQNALSPFYSQDPRTTRLGFRAGTVGNPDWMTGAGNANPLVAILGAGATAPGMADGGSFTVGGGYSANDNRMAVFPVASGEEVVVNRNPQGGGRVINIDNRIVVSGSVDADTLNKLKISKFQQAQRMRSQLAQA